MLLTREELRERLIALHQASLELVKDVSLETLLERIASVACEQAATAAERRARFVAEAQAARKEMLRTGKGYDADEVGGVVVPLPLSPPDGYVTGPDGSLLPASGVD